MTGISSINHFCHQKSQVLTLHSRLHFFFLYFKLRGVVSFSINQTTYFLDSQGKCGPPLPTDNGDVTSLLTPLYPLRSVVEFQYQAYCELQGSRISVCQNGEWSEPPKCLGKCFRLLVDPGKILVLSMRLSCL